MSSTLNKFVIFAAGATIGSVGTWLMLKRHYEQIAQEEIESVKETFARRRNELMTKDEEDYQPSEEDVDNYNEKANEYRTSDGGKKDYTDMPYVIPPEDFGDYEDYERVSLTYYADGVLVDEDDEPIEDIEDTVGEESLSSFGKYDDDAVYVRNNTLKRDYEILLDRRRYSDIRKVVYSSDKGR